MNVLIQSANVLLRTLLYYLNLGSCELDVCQRLKTLLERGSGNFFALLRKKMFDFYLLELKKKRKSKHNFVASLKSNKLRQIFAPSSFCHKNSFFLSGEFPFAFLCGTALFLLKNNSVSLRQVVP